MAGDNGKEGQMITDERLKELQTACTILPYGVVKNYVLKELYEALSELLTARQTIQKLIKAGNKLYHDLYAMRTHKGYEPFTCETRWDELMEKMRNETEL